MKEAGTSNSRIRRPRFILSVVALGAIFAVLGLAVPASAAQPVTPGVTAGAVPVKPNSITPNNLLRVSVTQDGVNMRPCAAANNSTCPPIGTANRSHTLNDWCYVSGAQANGDIFWDVVFDVTTGKAGFISESLLNTSTQLSHC